MNELLSHTKQSWSVIRYAVGILAVLFTTLLGNLTIAQAQQAYIRLDVTPGEEVMLGLITSDASQKANKYVRHEISTDYDNPSQITITPEANTLTIWSVVAEVDCSKNGTSITGIDIAGNKEIGVLYCHKNALTSLKVDHCVNLIDLSCGENQITELNLEGTTSLQYLYCYKNKIAQLEVAHLKNLKEFSCDENRLTALNVEPLTRLEFFHCSDNQISELRFSKADRLTSFVVAKNKLTTIDLSALTHVEDISLGSNLFATLTAPKSDKLRRFFVSLNPNLKTLEIDATNNIEELSAMECRLETLDLTILHKTKKFASETTDCIA